MNIKRQSSPLEGLGVDFCEHPVKKSKALRLASVSESLGPMSPLLDSSVERLLENLAHSHTHIRCLPACRINHIFSKYLQKFAFETEDFLATSRLSAFLRLFEGSRLNAFQLDSWVNPIDGARFTQAFSRCRLSWSLLKLTNCSLSGKTSTRKPAHQTGIVIDCLDLTGSVFLSTAALIAWTPLLLSAKRVICGDWTGKLPLSSADSLFLVQLAKVLNSPFSMMESITCCFNGSARFLSGLAFRNGFIKCLNLKVSTSDDAKLLPQLIRTMPRLESLSILGDAAFAFDSLDCPPKRQLTSLTLHNLAISSRAFFEGFGSLKELSLYSSKIYDRVGIFDILKDMDYMPQLRCLVFDQELSATDMDALDHLHMFRPWLRVKLDFNSLLGTNRMFLNVDILE